MLPRVAPEVRIYYYIERYYGVARPARFVKFGETPRGDDERRRPRTSRAAAARLATACRLAGTATRTAAAAARR